MLVKSVITLGGRPALKLVVKAKVTDGPLPENPKFLKDELEHRKQRDAKRTTYLLTANKNRVVQIQINTLGEPDAGPAEHDHRVVPLPVTRTIGERREDRTFRRRTV